MKVQQANHRLEIGGMDSPVSKAKIMATAGMFKIMYDKLYTYKEEAILRELLANAWDAHVAAGNTDTPIEIHLPTELEPWFEIKDFGTGLAPEHVHRMYDYGATDKDHSSEFIGGFGIGAKTPLCLTDQFSVVTRWHGAKHTYQVFLDSDGTPSCMSVGQRDTDEPNGVTIHVPISPSAWNTQDSFQTAFKRLYPFVPTPPKCNHPVPEQPGPRYAVDITTIPGIQKVELYNRGSDNTVVMGTVPYRAAYWGSLAAKQASRATGVVDRVGTSLQHMKWVIFADIDTFEVGAPRESITQNEASEALIIEALTEAYRLVITQQKETLATTTSLRNWCEAFHRLNEPRGYSPPQDADLFIYQGSQLGTGPGWLSWDPKLFFGLVDAEYRGLWESTTDIARGYRSSNESRTTNLHLLVSEIFVYVIPKGERRPIHNALEKHYENGTKGLAMVVYGDLAKVEALTTKYDLPWTVAELPLIKKERQTRAKFGAAHYDYYIYENNSYMGHREDTLENIEERENAPGTLFVVAESSELSEWVARALHHKILRSKSEYYSRVVGVTIPEAHNKVRERFTENGRTINDTHNINDLLTIDAKRWGFVSVPPDLTPVYPTVLTQIAGLIYEEVECPSCKQLHSLIMRGRRRDTRKNNRQKSGYYATVFLPSMTNLDVTAAEPYVKKAKAALEARAAKVEALIQHIDTHGKGLLGVCTHNPGTRMLDERERLLARALIKATHQNKGHDHVCTD